MKASSVFLWSGLALASFSSWSVFGFQEARECSAEQLSFERIWNSYQISETDAVTSSDSVAPSCILKAMKKFEGWAKSKPVYASCETESSEPKRTKVSVCKTQTLIENITRIYNQFTQCTGIDSKFFFLAISSESGFFPNAFAPGADAGIGQLTAEAVVDVNNNWEALTAPIRNSDQPACVQMKAWMEELKVPAEQAAQSCQFISSAKNPARNLLYALLLFQKNRGYYQSLFGETQFKNQLTVLRKASLKSDEQSKWIDHLSLLTYNMGFVRLSGLLLDFMQESLKPFNEQSQQAEELRSEIKLLQRKVAELRKDRKFSQSPEYDRKVAELKKEYQKVFRQMREPLVTIEQLDPLNVEPKAFGAYLRQKKEAHYVDLLLQRAKVFNSGAESCGKI